MSKSIHCLVTFDSQVGDFLLYEVCGNKEDCKKRGDEARELGNKYPICFEFSHDGFVDFMISQRLGKIHDVLVRLEKRNTRSTLREKIAHLWGRFGFPIVTERRK